MYDEFQEKLRIKFANKVYILPQPACTFQNFRPPQDSFFLDRSWINPTTNHININPVRFDSIKYLICMMMFRRSWDIILKPKCIFCLNLHVLTYICMYFSNYGQTLDGLLINICNQHKNQLDKQKAPSIRFN